MEKRKRKTRDEYPVVVHRKREPVMVSSLSGDDEIGTSSNPFLNPFLYQLERSQVGTLEYATPPATGYIGVRNNHVEMPPASLKGSIAHVEQNSPQFPQQPLQQLPHQPFQQILFPAYGGGNIKHVVSPGCVVGNDDLVKPIQNLSSLNVTSNPFLGV